MLKDVFDSAGAHNDTGIFMLSVSAKHPILNMAQRYDDERLINGELNAKVADLEKENTAMSETVQGKFSLWWQLWLA